MPVFDRLALTLTPQPQPQPQPHPNLNPNPNPNQVPGFDSLADNGGAFTTLTGDDLRGREDLGRVGGGSASTYY